MYPTILLGAGGHAKVVIEILRETHRYRPVGCLGQPPEGCQELIGVPVLGNDDLLGDLRRQGIEHAFVAIGDNRLRQLLIDKVRRAGFQLVNAISRQASVSASAVLGEGIAIMPGAHVGTETRLEDGVILNTRSVVDHDGVLGECVHIGPGAILAGSVTVGAQAFVATGSSVIPHMRIGARSIVGAGSVVVRDIPADVVAYGSPALARRPLGASAPPVSVTSKMRRAG